MKDTLLLIDQGTHSTRAIIHDAVSIIVSASLPISSHVYANGFAEQSADEILQSVRLVLQQLSESLTETDINQIQSAALVVQRSSFIACEKNSGKPLTPVISWQDTRNSAYLDTLKIHWPYIQKITGLRPNAHYGASKMHWLLEHDVAVKKAYAENNLIFLPLAAYLVKELTQSKHFLVDGVIAARMLLLDIASNNWNDDLLSLFSIDKGCLPQVVPNHYSFGDITTDYFLIPLHLVGGDQSYIAFSAGLPIDNNTAYINIGSGAFVQMVDENFVVSDGLLKSVLTIKDNKSITVLEGTVNAAATALDWLWENEHKQLSISDIEKALLEKVNPPVFINTVAGIGSPHWLKAQEPFFIGEGNLLNKAVAVIESIIFALQDNIFRFAYYNKQLNRIVIGGGLSQFEALCQKLANLSGMPVMQLKTHEMSAQGLAYYVLDVQFNHQQITKIYQPQQDEALALRYAIYQQNLPIQ